MPVAAGFDFALLRSTLDLWDWSIKFVWSIIDDSDVRK
jgi:hypothetical protein